MPINRVKDAAGQSRFEFEFSRRLEGGRVRARKLLPPSWDRTQADAFDRKESARLYAQARGIERPSFSISQAVASYVDERIPELGTGQDIAKELNRLLPWYRGKPLAELPEVCAQYLTDNRERLAPATLRNRLRYLTSACRWGWKKHNMCESDPAARVAMPAVSNERHVYIDRRQMLQLARACKTSWEVRAAIRIAFYSGMRLGELLRAEVEGDVWNLGKTKNGDQRIVPMHPRCRVYSDYVWRSRFVMNDHFVKAREAIGMPQLHFHDLRHSAASAMINNDVDLYTVGGVLGHRSSASTQRYAHLAMSRLRAAIGKIGVAA